MPTSGSGTGELVIRGCGSMAVEADGTHRITFDYELEADRTTRAV